MAVSYTPMLEQYREIKTNHPGSILFFRLGDFYEMFFEDAQIASREMEITLTSREGGGGLRVPMCGVPYHAADTYIARLISKGFNVAICEQVEDPKLVKGLVKREVVKVITPGTILSDLLLPDSSNNYLALIHEADDSLFIAAADITTADFLWCEFKGVHRFGNLCDQLFRLRPAEIVISGKIHSWDEIQQFIAQRIVGCVITNFIGDDLSAMEKLPAKHFPVAELPTDENACRAVGLLLGYLYQTVKSELAHLNCLTKYESKDYLTLDAITLRNLEVTANMRDKSKNDSLFGILDSTCTAMGGRQLKKWLEFPLMNVEVIHHRQAAVGELVENLNLRHSLGQELAPIYDFERILTRIEVGTANPRDLVGLKESLAVLPAIKNLLQSCQTDLLRCSGISLKTHTDITQLINDAIADNPPLSLKEGGMIRHGYNLELDELTMISTDSKTWVQQLESREREATGIKSLKISYNKVFGYYIEITHANTDAVPLTYTRKQTLANAERYITPELKEFEIKILGAQEKIIEIEYQIFAQIREYIKPKVPEIQQSAKVIAEVDAILSLSTAAVNNNYICPQINNSQQIIIKDGRHPVVEKLLRKDLFVPNDTSLNHLDSEIWVITGPNMAGKSTYMRQVALLVLMTQIGSFIPAREASICPVDRIFTRVGATDDLSSGQSTFMMEMNEVAHILRHATNNSLIILDEIGRGTSTFDGMSIAQAVIEFILAKIKAKTLFATHYHELTRLEKMSPRIRNYSVAVKERGTEVVFLRRIISGRADKSYGIHVAQLAGLPAKLVERAQAILADMENNPQHQTHLGPIQPTYQPPSTAISLFESKLVDEIIALDVMTLTPLEALNLLYQLQIQAKQEAGKG